MISSKWLLLFLSIAVLLDFSAGCLGRRKKEPDDKIAAVTEQACPEITLDNAQVTFEPETKGVDSEAIITCSGDYELYPKNSDRLKCRVIQGTGLIGWDGNFPNCIAHEGSTPSDQACSEITIENGEVDTDLTHSHHLSKATITCDEGFTLIPKNPNLRCFDVKQGKSQFYWHGKFPNCKAADGSTSEPAATCEPSDVANADTVVYTPSLNSDSTADAGTVATVTCSVPYKLSDDTPINCVDNEDGTADWDGPFPTCIESTTLVYDTPQYMYG